MGVDVVPLDEFTPPGGDRIPGDFRRSTKGQGPRAERDASIEIVEFADNMHRLVASAVGVISMAGYNTVVEEVAADVPALLTTRRARSTD